MPPRSWYASGRKGAAASGLVERPSSSGSISVVAPTCVPNSCEELLGSGSDEVEERRRCAPLARSDLACVAASAVDDAVDLAVDGQRMARVSGSRHKTCLRFVESGLPPSASTRRFRGCGSSTYVHSCPWAPHAAHAFRPSVTTHLLFRFRQASHGRSRFPRGTRCPLAAAAALLMVLLRRAAPSPDIKL